MKERFFDTNPYCSCINLSIRLDQSKKIMTTELKLKSDYEKNFSSAPFYYLLKGQYSFIELDKLLDEIGTRINSELQAPVEMIHEINIVILKKSRPLVNIEKSRIPKEMITQIMLDLREQLALQLENSASNSKCLIS